MIVANKSDRSPDNVRPCGHFTYCKFLEKDENYILKVEEEFREKGTEK